MEPTLFDTDSGAHSRGTGARRGVHRAAWLGLLGIGQSLKLRLAVASLVALFAGMAVTAWKMDRIFSAETLAAAQTRELNEARHAMALLAQRKSDLQRALFVAAEQLREEDWRDREALGVFLAGKPVLREMFSNVAIAGKDGRVRVLADAAGVRSPQTTIGDRPYFLRTLETGKPQISEPMMGRVSSEPILVFTQPVRLDGEVVGLLIGALRLASQDLLAGLTQGPTGADDRLTLVSDAQGRILSHPVRHRLLEPVNAEPGINELIGPNADVAQVLVGEGARSWQGARHVIVVASDPHTGWQVWRSVSIPGLLAPARAAHRLALMQAAVVAVGLAVLLLIWLHRSLRPLGQLERRAHALMSGDADQDWPQAGGEIGALAHTLRHVATERRQVELFNQRVLHQLNSVMAAAPVGLAFTRDRRFELVSAEFCRLLGRREADLHGQPAQTIFASNEDYVALGPKVAEAFARSVSFEGEIQLLRSDGSTFWSQMMARPVVPGDPSAGTIWSISDITDRVIARRDLEHAAHHDPLTGVANRKAFDQALAAAALRAAPDRSMSVVMIDLDRFKPINDTAGHAAGDAMLREVARVVGRQVRDRDIVARLGGDEFAVLLDNCGHEQAGAVAEKVRQAICDIALPWEGRTLQLGASLGVAQWSPAAHARAADWLAAADAACYEAKRSGRNAVRGAARVLPLRAGVSNG